LVEPAVAGLWGVRRQERTAYQQPPARPGVPRHGDEPVGPPVSVCTKAKPTKAKPPAQKFSSIIGTSQAVRICDRSVQPSATRPISMSASRTRLGRGGFGCRRSGSCGRGVVLLSAVATVLYGISLWLVETYSPDAPPGAQVPPSLGRSPWVAPPAPAQTASAGCRASRSSPTHHGDELAVGEPTGVVLSQQDCEAGGAARRRGARRSRHKAGRRCCDRTTVEVSHLHSINVHFTAHSFLITFGLASTR
jgi:hypothetical protein